MILYFGNKLSIHGFTPTMIELLLPEFKKQYKIISASSKLNTVIRLFDMLLVFFKNINNAKLILIDTYSTNAFYYTYIIAKLSSIYSKPYCPILHGGALPNRLASSPKLSRFIFGKSFINISPSIYLKQIFEREGFKIQHIPNFIEISNYPMKSRKKIRPKLLWVRAYHKIYNPLLAIYILEKLMVKWNDAELCMVGPDKDGSLNSIILLANQLGVKDNLYIHGKLEKEDWITLSQKYDIFLNTSQFDNQPVSLMEAMALGLPIITTNVGGISSLINNKSTGILVNSNDPDEFVIAINELISGEINGLNLAKNARIEIHNYDKAKIINKWVDFIDSTIK
ncbi:MAG: glycosyltransferase family 4 protein [Candidatus Marinimicrobia bacterium]|nr:glycosyltransferase family 4 protein [Candidatus Neomarinimicrobiota bacterium]